MTNEKGVSKGFGFVCYDTQEEAQKAINGIGKSTVLPNCYKPLYVAIHEPKEMRQQRYSRPRGKMTQQNMYGGSGTIFYQPPYNQQMMRQFGQYGNMQFVQQGQPQGVQQGQGQPQPPQQQQQPQPRGQQRQMVQGQGQDKQYFGQQLFEKIQEREPNLARKITGMIIHSPDFSPETVNELLRDDTKIDNIIKDAKVYLEQQQRQNDEGNEEENFM